MATTLADKLQLKPGQRMLVRNVSSRYFERLVADLPQASLDLEQADALLLFVGSLAEVAELTPGAIKAVGQNGLLWIAYPKGGSGVKTDVNRDKLAADPAIMYELNLDYLKQLDRMGLPKLMQIYTQAYDRFTKG